MTSTITDELRDVPESLNVLEGLQLVSRNLHRVAESGYVSLTKGENKYGDRHLSYNFSDWSACTCGHIYLAANGHVGSVIDVADEYPPHRNGGTVAGTLYGRMLRAVVDANRSLLPLDGWSEGTLPQLVSRMTASLSDERYQDDPCLDNRDYALDAAIVLIDNAITRVENIEREAMEAAKSPTRVPPVIQPKPTTKPIAEAVR